MRIFRFAVISFLILSACKKEVTYDNLESVSEEVIFNEQNSMYDSIVAPTISVDTSLFYSRLSDYLKFTNSIGGDGDSYCFVKFLITENGEIKIRSIDANRAIEKNMQNIVPKIFSDIGLWQPAYMKTDPNRKLPYKVTLYLIVKETTLGLRIYGEEHYYFLRKDYKRPL